VIFSRLPILFTAAVAITVYASAPQTSATPYYLPADITNSFQLNPPHPIGSAPDQEDIRALRSAQENRTQADCSRAETEASLTSPAYQEFFGAVGPFPTPLKGEVREFFIHIWSDAAIVSETFKNKYKWTRAFNVDPSIQPCLAKTASYSYPSGHALVSRVFALVLSDIDPSKRSVYLKRSDEIARDRLIAGMHRPNELAAGKKLADEIHEKMLKSALFLQDIKKMKALLASKTP
jgi:acid phosphatase (class A)